MIIKNESDTQVFIHGNVIIPDGEYKCIENVFNTVYVNSDIGSVVITTEYSQRSFRMFGDLMAEEAEETDVRGLRVIRIRRKSK